MSGAATLPCTICTVAAPRENAFRDIVLHRCPSCDHCFTDIESLDYLGEYDEAWESLHTHWFANPNTRLFDLAATAIERQKPDARVIDVGCGHGELLGYLRRRSPRLSLVGLDIALAPEIEGVDVIVGDMATADLGGRRFDVVTSLATIEHVADVRAFAGRLHDLLVPGGLAIVMTLDDRSVLYATARLLYRAGYRNPYERLYDRFHLNHFNSRSLRTLMERSGFETLAHHHHNIPLDAVDMPTDSPILRAGVLGTFLVGRLTRRTFEQTIVARRL